MEPRDNAGNEQIAPVGQTIEPTTSSNRANSTPIAPNANLGSVKTWSDRRHAVKRQLDRARDFHRRIGSGQVSCAAEVASQDSLSQSRVGHLLRLLDLASDIQADIDDADADRPMLGERKLRSLARVRPDTVQLTEYRRLLATEPVPLTRGLQHRLADARRYAAMLDDGTANTYTKVGQLEGVSRERIRQLVLLIHLDPRILAQIDVPADERPAVVTEKALRPIARLREGDEQLLAFGELLAGAERGGG